jgi:hypothetical protein
LELTKPEGYETFKCSSGWVSGFCKRWGITNQARTNKKDVPIAVKKPVLQAFHRDLYALQYGSTTTTTITPATTATTTTVTAATTTTPPPPPPTPPPLPLQFMAGLALVACSMLTSLLLNLLCLAQEL